MQRTPRLTGWALLLLLLALGGPARATVVSEMDIEELADQATDIVHGVVVAAQPVRRDGRIMTDVEVEVQERLKGERGPGVPNRISLVVPGGSHAGYSQIVPGAPRLAVGEEVVLFLWRGGRDEQLRVLGLSLGAFAVDRAAEAPVAVSDRSGLAIIRRGESSEPHQHAGHAPEERLPLAELLGRIRARVPAEAPR